MKPGREGPDMLYTTYGAFQREMKAFYERTGSMLQFPEMMQYMLSHGMLQEGNPSWKPPEGYEFMTDEDFDRVIDGMPLIWYHEDESGLSPEVAEEDIFPMQRDVFLMRHPRYTRSYRHTHNYFEIDCVAKGTITFVFEKEPNKVLHEGEVVIIAPGSSHDMYTFSDDSCVYSICIRKSTFQAAFFRQMDQKNLLTYFFQTILQGNGRPNYLMFYTGDHSVIVRCLRSALVECITGAPYSNEAVISLCELMFIQLLRNYSQTVSFYNYSMGSDFSLVLQYIQHNYRTVTLSSLASFFHYSEPHLCTLIRRNTGHTFSDLIRELRMQDAKRLLRDTDMKISDIADTVGYNSADHFSRVFRREMKQSPADYRAAMQREEHFIPFHTEGKTEAE